MRYKILAGVRAGKRAGNPNATPPIPDMKLWHVVPEYRTSAVASEWYYEGGTGVEFVKRPQATAAEKAAIPSCVIEGNTIAELKAAMSARANSIVARVVATAPIPAAAVGTEFEADP